MYSRQRRFPTNSTSNTPPLTPNTIAPSSPIVSSAVKFGGRAAPTLPRSISPISSAGQRPYSPNSSAQSTFTSDFPSEFGSIRIRKETWNRAETPPPLPVNSMSIPRKAPPLVIDTSSAETQTESAITRRERQKPPEVNAEVVPEPPLHLVEVSATINVRPPSDQSSIISGGSSEHDTLSQPGSEPGSPGLVPPPPRAPIAPPRLSLSTAPNEDGEWSSSLLSSFGSDFGLAEFISSPTGPIPLTSEDKSDPNADSPALQTPLAVRSSSLGARGAPSILAPQSAASSSSELLDADGDDSRRDTIRPNSLLTPTLTHGLKYFSASSLLPQSSARSNSIRSVLTASSRDANSSRGSLDDVEGASIAKPHVVKRVSVARAITVRAKRRSATMQPSANGAPPVLVPAVPSPNRITINGAKLPAAASLAAVMTDPASAKRRPPPIRETTASPSLSADEPPTPGLTNNSRKSTEHTDGSSSICSPMASPMVPGFSKGGSNGLPVRDLYEDGEDDNEMLDDITSAYATETFVDDDRSARRLTQVPRETEVAYLQNASVRITDPPTPHSAVNVPRPRAPSPISPSPATPSSFKTTRGMYTGAGSVSDEPYHKRPTSLLGTQTLSHSPARSAPRSPVSGGARTPRASSSPQGAQGKLSSAAWTGATLGVPSPGLQTSVIAHPKRSPVSPLDKELPPPPIDDAPLIQSSKMNAKHQQSATIDTLDMVKSRKLFAPLNPYLSATDPRVRFTDFAQVAEGQWGPVYAARAREAGTSISVKSFSSESSTASRFGTLVAVKTIKVEEEGSSKVDSFASELAIMADVRHEHILFTAGLFVNEDTLWVEMELMERSLADMLPLVEQGLVVSEPEVARFASDVGSVF